MASPDAASLYAAAGSSATLLDSIFKTEAVGQILLMVNLTILAAGTFWLMWNILAGITQSAWDGELLGKRFHTLWMPIRNAIGIAMLVPAFGGWGAAQLILYQAAKMGAGAANIALANGANSITAPTPAHYKINGAPDYAGLSTSVYAINLCKAMTRQAAAQIISMNAQGAEFGGTTAEFESSFYQINKCGSLGDAPEGPLKAVHESALRQLDQTLGALATRVASQSDQYSTGSGPRIPDQEVVAAIDAATKAYAAAILAASNEKIGSTITSANKAGGQADWLGFGYRHAAAASSYRQIAGAMNELPSVISPTATGGPAEEAAAKSSSLFSRFLNGVTGGLDTMVAFFKSLSDAPGKTLLKWWMGDEATTTLSGDGGDLIAALSGLGTAMVGTGTKIIAVMLALYGLIAGLALGGVLSAGIAAVLPAALWVGVLAIGIIIPLVGMGLTMSAYLPLVPALFWTLAVVGWLLTVAESLFMAPLWAFIHLETDGEGMGQKTEKGYSFIMNLILKPLVMVFAFTIAPLILNATWAMLAEFITGAMATTNKASFAGLFTWLGMVFALMTIAMAMVYKVYGVATGLADAIPAWLGTNFHNYSASAESTGFGAGGDAGGAVGRALQNPALPKNRVAGSDKEKTETPSQTPTSKNPY
jgi:conjugal transfer/type IV secretion protein DotA/TraY